MAQAIASSPLARAAYAAVAPHIAPIGTYLEASQRADIAWANIAETRANYDPSNPEHVKKMEAHKQQWEGAYNDKIKARTPYEIAKFNAAAALQDVIRVKPEDGLHVMAHDFTSKSLHRDVRSREDILAEGDGSEGNKAIREQVVKSGDAAAEFALDWLSRIVDSRDRTLAVEIGYSSDGRAFAHRASGDAIVPVVALGYHLDLNNAKQSAVHEFGHFLEDNIEDIGNRARAFLRYRVGKEQRTDIGTVPGGEGMKGEMGRKDQFHRAFPDLPSAYYCGKSYDHGATEITAMGLEKLHSDPVGFFATDPEFAGFIVSLLRPPQDEGVKGRVTKAFDPNEPRDEKGEWTAGGSVRGKEVDGTAKEGYTSGMKTTLRERHAKDLIPNPIPRVSADAEAEIERALQKAAGEDSVKDFIGYSATEEHIPLSALSAPQTVLSKAALAYFLDNPDEIEDASPLPLVIQYGDTMMLRDGNNRTAAAMKLKRDKIKARVVYVPKEGAK